MLAHATAQQAAAPGLFSPLEPRRKLAWRYVRRTWRWCPAATAASSGGGRPALTHGFAELAAALAPDTLLKADYTPLGRGLVAAQPVAAGTPLLAVDWCHMLAVSAARQLRSGGGEAAAAAQCLLMHFALQAIYLSFHQAIARQLYYIAMKLCRIRIDALAVQVTDVPSKAGTEFSKRVLQDWQLLHHKMPPLLVAFLLSGELQQGLPHVAALCRLVQRWLQ